MKVQLVHKNKQLETINIEVIDFDLYCKKLSQDLIAILSDIENFFEKQKIVNGDDYYIDELYPVLRHRLFDVSGSLNRLPENIIKE